MTRNTIYSYDERYIDNLSFAAPAAGVELDITPSFNETMEILAFNFTYTAAAAAANRIITLEYIHNSITGIIARSPIILVANDVVEFTVIAGASNYLDTGATQAIIGIPQRFLLLSADVLRVSCPNIQALDTISATVVTYHAYKTMS